VARTRVAVAVSVCAACAVATWTQVSYWQDGVALFQRAVDVTADNYVARFNLADALSARGDDTERLGNSKRRCGSGRIPERRTPS